MRRGGVLLPRMRRGGRLSPPVLRAIGVALDQKRDIALRGARGAPRARALRHAEMAARGLQVAVHGGLGQLQRVRGLAHGVFPVRDQRHGLAEADVAVGVQDWLHHCGGGVGEEERGRGGERAAWMREEGLTVGGVWYKKGWIGC